MKWRSTVSVDLFFALYKIFVFAPILHHDNVKLLDDDVK